ncbi:MBL fold metallo-hydrolase [Candidatus Woesebacteria bacterium]|nr:MBL fold metallo-hydrolase [Candidatus Woesebacteria bacterium]
MPPALSYHVIELGALQTNCSIVWCNKTLQAVVIDPADSADVISQFLLENQLTLTAILLTHGHFDHVLGLLELSLNFDVPSYIHQKDEFLIKNAQKSAEYWLKQSVDPVPLPTHRYKGGDTICFGSCALHVLETPGHTPGSVCLYYTPEIESKNTDQFFDSEEQILWTGDTLFKESLTRTDFRYSSIFTLRESLRSLTQLPAQTVVLSGHGEATTLKEALAFVGL